MTETDVVVRRRAAEIPLHGPADFEGMRRAGRMVAECLDMLSEHVKPGVTTEFLDKLAFDFIRQHGAYPACLHYRGYTTTICTSSSCPRPSTQPPSPVSSATPRCSTSTPHATRSKCVTAPASR